MPYVYSTSTNSSRFIEYEHRGNDLPVEKKSVIIKGGSNVAKGRGLITKYGVRTEVSEDDLAWLLKRANFVAMMKAGFFKVDTARMLAEKAIGDLVQRDKSAPLVIQDFKKSDLRPDKKDDGKAKVVIGGTEHELTN